MNTQEIVKQTKEQISPLQKSNIYYNDILVATIPLIIMAVYLYGLRPLVLVVVAILTAYICDRLAAFMQKKPFEKLENSSLPAAVVFTLMLPASVNYYVLVFGVAAAILLGKYAFGGAKVYPFNLSAVGYAFVAVGWPAQIFAYPRPMQQLPLFSMVGVNLTESSSYLLKMGGLPNISIQNLLLGNYAGPMGTTFLIVIIACALFLIVRDHKIIYSAIGFLGMVAFIAFAFPRVELVSRINVMRYEILSGSFLYTAVFLIGDPNTTPKRNIAKAIYGAILGFISMMFRYFGMFELGVCFALIVTNTLSDFIDRTVSSVIKKAGAKRPVKTTAKQPVKAGGKPE